MPEAFAGDGAEGQGTEKVDEKDFRYVEDLPLSKRFEFATVAPVINCGFGVACQLSVLTHGHNILFLQKLERIHAAAPPLSQKVTLCSLFGFKRSHCLMKHMLFLLASLISPKFIDIICIQIWSTPSICNIGIFVKTILG